MEHCFPFNNTLHFVSKGYLTASNFLLYHQENTLKGTQKTLQTLKIDLEKLPRA